MNINQNFKKKPFIAITARSEMIRDIHSVINHRSYFEAIEKAGGIPVMIYHNDICDYDSIAKQFDGLLLPGGNDINPQFYGQIHSTKEDTVEEIIDILDIQLIQSFHKLNKPILGICRGMQCINVAFKGTLIQDIATEYTINRGQHDQRIKMPDMFYEDTKSHEIICESSTKLYECFGDSYYINSFHHQCVDKLADGFIASAYSKEDNIVEGIEKDNIIGVQWHPEWLLNDGKSFVLFQNLINEAKQYRNKYE